MEDKERLEAIVRFCELADKEKMIQRRTYLSDSSRFENDAEHAWHLALMAMFLHRYAEQDVDLLRVICIVLIHDLVEIYAGDTFAYDTEGLKSQKEREAAAAARLVAQLPEDMAEMLQSLWDEFEEDTTPEAHFAHTLDNFQPLMLQSATDGRAWQEGGRKLSEVLKRNAKTAQGSAVLWEYAKEHFIRPQIEKGHLQDDTGLE